MGIPPAAMSPATEFRWRQRFPLAAGEDNWALDNVVIKGPKGLTINRAPLVSAGVDQITASPQVAALTGSVTDDGLPFSSQGVSVQWKKLSGSGNVDIASPGLADTNVSFSEPGVYVFRLEASDGDLKTSRDVTVKVDPFGGTSIDIPWIVDDFDPVIDLNQWSAISGGRAEKNCGSLSGEKALTFDGAGLRAVKTPTLDANAGGSIRFALKMGFGTGTCPGEDGHRIFLQYRIAADPLWQSLKVYESRDFRVFTEVREMIPDAAKSSATEFRWVQIEHFSTNENVWAVDNVIIGGAFLSTTVAPSDPTTETMSQDVVVTTGGVRQKNLITPAEGGHVFEEGSLLLSGIRPADVFIPKGAVNREGILTILLEALKGDPQRQEALDRQGLKSLGLGGEIRMDPSDVFLLKPARLTIPFDPGLVPLSMDLKQLRLARFDEEIGGWVLNKNLTVSGEKVTAEVTNFSLFKPVLVLPDSKAGLREAYTFPNPARSPADPVVRALLGKVESVEITIFDVSGKKVHSASLNGRPTGTIEINGGYEFYYDYKWKDEKASGIYFAVIYGKSSQGDVRARAKFAVVR